MRNSIDAEYVNRRRTLAGIEWRLAVVLLIFFAYASVTTRNPMVAILGFLLFLFFSGASRRDDLFLQIYIRHTKQADRYSPAPVVSAPMRNRRPIGYGWRDPN